MMLLERMMMLVSMLVLLRMMNWQGLSAKGWQSPLMRIVGSMRSGCSCGGTLMQGEA